MRKSPKDLVREEVLALAAYHVGEAAGMVKLDAMENPYALPQELRREIAELVAALADAPNTIMLVVLKDGPIKTVADLKGKKVSPS